MPTAFYQLTQKPLAGPDGGSADYHRVEARDYPACEWPWLHGVSFEESPPVPLVLELETAGEVRPFADYMPWEIPLLSAQARQALTEAGVDNVDYYPVAAWHLASGSAPAYLAFNVVGAVSIVDAAASRSYKPLGPAGSQMFEKLLIDPTRAQGLHLFRMAESLSTLVASERVRQSCLAAGLASIDFLPLMSSK
jgi:hypothetical protein